MAGFPSRPEPAEDGRNVRGRRRLAPLLLIIALLAVGVTIGATDRLNPIVAPPATFVLDTPEPRTVEEQRYLVAVLPLTERLIAEGQLLSELGAARSRNLLELRTRAERFRTTAEEVMRLERVGGIPSRLKSFSVSLNLGIASALAAIDDAEAAVLRFEWEQVEAAVSAFTAAIDVIAGAIDQVEQG